MAKANFFTPIIAHEIFYKLVNEYLVLTEKDLTAWDADPEAYGQYFWIILMSDMIAWID